MQYINCYICTCLALFFILAFIQLPEYHILQFHASIFYKHQSSLKKQQITAHNYKKNVAIFIANTK